MELFRITFQFLEITLAGLFIAFSPMLFIVSLLVVMKSSKPVLHTTVLLVSMALPLLLLGIFAEFLVDPNSTISLRKVSETLSIPPLINVLAGIAILAWTGRALQRQKTTVAKKMSVESVRPPSLKVVPLFVFGFTKSLLSVSNVFAVLFVTKLTLDSNLSPVGATVLLLWALAIGMAPFFAILYYSRKKPEYITELESKINIVLNRNIRFYATLAVGMIGFWLLVSGLFRLL